MRVHRFVRLLRSLCAAAVLAVLLSSVCAVGAAPGARAQPLANISGAMALSITNGSTFQYDDSPGPRFHLVLTPSPPYTGPNVLFTAQIQLLDNGQQIGATFSGVQPDGTYVADAIGYRDNSNNPLAIGTHTATATLTNPAASPPIVSNQVSFTITQRSWSFSCGLGSLIVQSGQSQQVTLSAQSVDSAVPLDWTQGTASVWFAGATTVRSDNLQPNSAGVVSVTTPTQTGRYSLNCSFSGTQYYAAESMTTTNLDVLVSQMRQLGGVQLYTNPQTLVANQTTQMLVVFKAAPGQSTPTGEFNITMGTYNLFYTQSIQIGPNGSASLTLNPIANLYGANAITVHYFGDPTYNDQSVNFPMTNPAIPGGGSGGGGTGVSPQATTTATANSSGTPTTASGSGAQDTGATPAPVAGAVGSSGSSGFPWLLVLALGLLALLLAGGGTVVAVMLVRRSRMAPPSAEPWARETTLTPVSPRGWSTDEPTWPARGGNLDDPWR